MISKELLAEVLFGARISIKDLVMTRDNSLNYSIFSSINERDGTDFNSNIAGNYYVEKRIMYDDINIYELAHKCKEWALNTGRSLCTCPSTVEAGIYECYDRDFDDMELYYADTEPEAIFKACQWILDNKDQK